MPAGKPPRERRLPIQQLSILAICRFAEPIASTSLLPYLPEMVKSFNVAEEEVGKWAGLCSGMFSICQAVMGIPWGRFSDIYGRKLAILLGLTTTLFTSLLWGFSTNITMALIARGLAGAGNGNVGIIRTTVAEMVPFKELQPRAFSLMPLVWNVGSIFGPTIGGALANPYNVGPHEHVKNPNLLQSFPYALPNIVSACLFAIGITTGFLFLEETLETLHGQRDRGLMIGRKLSALVKSSILKTGDFLHLHKSMGKEEDSEREPLLKAMQDDESLGLQPKEPPPPPPSYSEVLNKQAILNLIVYTLLALHTMGYDALLPVFMNHTPLKGRTRSSSTHVSDNPLKFVGGLGLDHFRIGIFCTVYGVFGMLVQFLIFPSVARRFGVLNCLKVCAIAFPICYCLTPFIALFPTLTGQIGAAFAVVLIKCFAAIFAFPCSTILLTNSATSLRVLGTLNGVATSTSAIGRACGPAIGGAMYTIGVKAGYVIAPYWLFTLIGIISAVPVWWLVESEGFGDDGEGHISDEEEVDEEEQMLEAAGVEGAAEAAGQPGPAPIPVPEREEEAESYDAFRSLTRTTTMSSALTLGSALSEGGEDDAGWQVPTEMPDTGPQRAYLTRRGSRKVMRKMSIPLGMGESGFSRRYSSNLGHSLGSAGSHHGH